MARIRTNQDRQEENRRWVAMQARAIMESEPATPSVVVSLHVAEVGEQLPRVPIIGLEPGAIRGTIPHRIPDARWAR